MFYRILTFLTLVAVAFGTETATGKYSFPLSERDMVLGKEIKTKKYFCLC
jgi:uncharacterized Rossmann fold enzyme